MAAPVHNLQFQVKKSALRETRLVRAGAPFPETLAPGSALLRIDSFAFTANNVTYAALGDAMRYWSFFPTGDDAWGVIPVWGFANVVASTAPGVEVGARYYGFFPMATHMLAEPEAITAASFSDGAAHRKGLSPIYNQYTLCGADSLYDARFEAEQALLRPLFTTSFLIDDLFADSDFFGARNILLSSASSKTAWATAFLLARRTGIKTVGLTSARNRDFVKGLQCYTDAVAYEDIANLTRDEACAYIDFAGSPEIRRAVHTHFADDLRYSCSVGLAQWEAATAPAESAAEKLPGAAPKTFFAPARARKRLVQWTPAGFETRLADAWREFMAHIQKLDGAALRVVQQSGEAGVRETVLAQLEGRAAPADGYILSL